MARTPWKMESANMPEMRRLRSRVGEDRRYRLSNGFVHAVHEGVHVAKDRNSILGMFLIEDSPGIPTRGIDEAKSAAIDHLTRDTENSGSWD